MTATNHTEHYRLSQYTKDDHPTYTGDYNGDMLKIDAAIHAAAQSGGMTATAHDTTLTGDGTDSSPLGINKFTSLDDNPDFNAITSLGMYLKRWGTTALNAPYSSTASQYLLWVNSTGTEPLGDVVQLVIPIGGVNADAIWVRCYANHINWTQWKRLAFMSDIPDVSALTSRIATLEQQVAALTAAATPETTGLTAKELDTQYSDSYNIVRVGTPTRTTETEESSHE